MARHAGSARPSAPGVPARPARQKRAVETRERVIEAALQAFAERGFDGATTREIAARAGINQGLIGYHFASKEDLWKAAVERIFGLLRGSFAQRLEALADVDAGTRLAALVRHFVRFAASHPELHRLMVQEGKRDGSRMQWLVDRHVRPLYELSTELIRQAQAENAVPAEIPPVHLYYMLLGAAAHLFVVAPECRHLTGGDPMAAQMIEQHAEAVAALMLHGTR